MLVLKKVNDFFRVASCRAVQRREVSFFPSFAIGGATTSSTSEEKIKETKKHNRKPLPAPKYKRLIKFLLCPQKSPTSTRKCKNPLASKIPSNEWYKKNLKKIKKTKNNSAELF